MIFGGRTVVYSTDSLGYTDYVTNAQVRLRAAGSPPQLNTTSSEQNGSASSGTWHGWAT